jgi:predicted metal-dependent peptidase
MSTITDVEKLYKDAVEYLDDNYAYFLTEVLNIGYPSWSSQIPTACVALPDDETPESDFTFMFNPDFAGNLEPEEFAFILAHETMHILLNHLTLCKSSSFPNKKMFNIAADCVINDYLGNGGFTLIDGIMRGEDVVGFNCANSTVTEVYNLLEQKYGGDDGDGDEEGSNSALSDLISGAVEIDDHSWMHDPDFHEALSKALKDALEAAEKEVPEDLEEIRDETKNTYSSGFSNDSGGEQTFIEEHGVSLNWVRLLQEVDPELFKEKGMGPKPLTSFRRPRRKLMSMYPDVIVPIYDEPSDEVAERSPFKPSIVMALDTSDSIGRATANRFVNLARSVPQDKIDLHVITFTTSVRKLDLQNPKFNRGGTAFSPIERYIRDKVMPNNGGNYPKAVVVITDGEATFNQESPSEVNRKSWRWLICKPTSYSWGGGHYVQRLRSMFGDKQILNLKDFIN